MNLELKDDIKTILIKKFIKYSNNYLSDIDFEIEYINEENIINSIEVKISSNEGYDKEIIIISHLDLIVFLFMNHKSLSNCWSESLKLFQYKS
jgi:hypothetical protein